MRKRNRHKIIIGIEVMILSITVSLLGPNAASSNPPSNGVSYNKNGQVTVENALDNLYSKANYGNATANDILKGKKALVGGKEVVGTFTCPTLASLTPGDATASNIDKGKIAWVNGNKVVGTRKVVLADKVKLGDYISYTPSSTAYTISSLDTGYKEDQVINPSELNLWRVIRRNVDGTVELVSEYVSSGLKFGGTEEGNKIAYKNYIGTLVKIAKQYENNEYTIGSRPVGYDGVSKLYLTDADERVQSYSDDWYKYLDDVGLMNLALGSSGAYERNGEDGAYMLAVRRPIKEQMVMTSGGYPSNTLISGYNQSGFSFRPIVILNSSINVIGGTGIKSSPYILGT